MKKLRLLLITLCVTALMGSMALMYRDSARAAALAGCSRMALRTLCRP